MRIILNPAKPILWDPEQEALLKSLRLSAGLDLATLARRNIVSTTQVRQLENGGDSSFYSPEIKFSVGKKLLKYLGHDLKPEVAHDPLLFTKLDLAPSETTLLEPVHSETVSIDKAAEILIAKSDASLPSHSASKAPSSVFPVLISGAAVCASLWFFLGKEDSPLPKVVTNSPAALKLEPQVNLNAAATAEKPNVLPDAENKTDSPQTTSSQQDAAQTSLQSACSWSNEQEEIQPESPRKVGDYVHVVAQQAITVCIMDGQQRVATLNLKVAEGRSIYGLPPFRVYSADFKEIEVYFQGQKIKLSNQDTQQIKLTAAPYMPLKN